MKNLIKSMLLCAIAAVGLSATSCDKDPGAGEVPVTTETYSVILSTTEGGSAKASIGTKTVVKSESGEVVTITATADTGFEFTKWTVEGGGAILEDPANGTTTFVMPANDVTIKAEFTAFTEQAYIITLQDAEGGEAVAKVNGAVATQAASGQTVIVTATPAAGWEFVEWTSTDNAVEFSQPASTETHFLMPENDVTIIPVFREVPYYNIVIDKDLIHGTIEITADGETVTSARLGQTVKIKATPEYGWVFNRWYLSTMADADMSQYLANYQATETTFTMPNFTVLVNAYFSAAMHPITVYDDGNGKVWINNSAGGQQGIFGRDVTATGIPNEGYQFKAWTNVEGITIEDPTVATIHFKMPNNAVKLTATFELYVAPVQDYVEIAGTKWALKNVGTPGEFVENSTDHGLLYQWGYPVGWDYTSPTPQPTPAGSEWRYATSNWVKDTTPWASSTQPCPAGYRIPSEGEFSALFAATTSSNESEGVRLTDTNNTVASVFFPKAGYINSTISGDTPGSTSDVGNYAYYWSETAIGTGMSPNARCAAVHNRQMNNNSRRYAMSIRCVSAE